MALGWFVRWCCVCATFKRLLSNSFYMCFFCFITLHTGNSYASLNIFFSSLFTFHFYVSWFGLHPPSFHIWLQIFLHFTHYLLWTRKFVSYASETKRFFSLSLFMSCKQENKTCAYCNRTFLFVVESKWKKYLFVNAENKEGIWMKWI